MRAKSVRWLLIMGLLGLLAWWSRGLVAGLAREFIEEAARSAKPRRVVRRA